MGARLVLVSSRHRDPGDLPPERPAPPDWVPVSFHGAQLDVAIRHEGVVFLVYGPFLVRARERDHTLRYAFDFSVFMRPPNRGELEPVTCAREIAGVLYVSNSHLTAEPDFLHLLDRRSGRVLDSLPVPSAPEIIRLRGTTLHVRTYARQLVVKVES